MECSDIILSPPQIFADRLYLPNCLLGFTAPSARTAPRGSYLPVIWLTVCGINEDRSLCPPSNPPRFAPCIANLCLRLLRCGARSTSLHLAGRRGTY